MTERVDAVRPRSATPQNGRGSLSDRAPLQLEMGAQDGDVLQADLSRTNGHRKPRTCT